MLGPRKSKQCCARRSPGDALKDAGSIPATSTKPPNAPDLIEVRGVRRLRPGAPSRSPRPRGPDEGLAPPDRVPRTVGDQDAHPRISQEPVQPPVVVHRPDHVPSASAYA